MQAVSRNSSQNVVLGKHNGKVDERWKHNSSWRKPSQFLEQRKQQYVLLSELKVCSRKKNLERGKEIHAQAKGSRNDSCIFVATALINMYAKCGSMFDARHVFDSIENPDVVSWTALIVGYTENREGIAALDMFARMKFRGCAPNCNTYAAALKACISLLKQDGSRRADCLEQGRQIHLEIGCHSDIYVQSTLIDMYAKCGEMVEARQVFDSIKKPNVVSWTSLISGYTENGEVINALDLFAKMKTLSCEPDSMTFVAALKACTTLALREDSDGKAECLMQGKQIHSEIGCRLDIHLQSTLIDMYANCGSMVDAHQVFDGIDCPDVVSWSALILGYVEKGEGVTALNLFVKMRNQGCVANSITYVAALKACGILGALESGKKIHAEIDSRIECNAILVTSLIDFYAKCGCLVEAQNVFDSYSGTKDLIIWNALIAGYSRVGDSKFVFRLFHGMQAVGFQADGVTFLSILTCCSHAGVVSKAKDFFEIMSRDYNVTPDLEHYTCMVDILGRSNKLDEAIVLLQSMPFKPSAVTWMTVLGACRKWKNVEIGRVAFTALMSVDKSNGAAYFLMAHIYGSRGMWEEQEMVFEMRPEQSSWTNQEGQQVSTNS